MQVPCGRSGDQLSRQFERFLPEWARGEMHAVEFYHDLADAKARGAQIVELQPGVP
jgi:hypothetical protein